MKLASRIVDASLVTFSGKDMVSTFWRHAVPACVLALAALGVMVPAASAQTATLYSSGVAQPTDIIVLAPGGAAYVASNTGLYYLPTPAGAPVLISAARQYREIALLPDGSLLGASTDGRVYRYAAGCTTFAGCGEAFFVALGGFGGAYGIAVDAVNKPAEYLGAKLLIQTGRSLPPETITDESRPMKELVASAR